MNILSKITCDRTLEITIVCVLAACQTGAQIGVQAASPSTSAASDTAAPRVMMVSGGLASGDAGSIVREIDDPHSGARWLLLHDSRHAGGPGRLVLAAARQINLNPISSPDSKLADTTSLPVVRAGDPLVIEEHTAIADARLEAVALGPAALGGFLRARLKIGGKIVPAVCLSAGRASLTVEPEVRR